MLKISRCTCTYELEDNKYEKAKLGKNVGQTKQNATTTKMSISCTFFALELSNFFLFVHTHTQCVSVCITSKQTHKSLVFEF